MIPKILEMQFSGHSITFAVDGLHTNLKKKPQWASLVVDGLMQKSEKNGMGLQFGRGWSQSTKHSNNNSINQSINKSID